MKSPDDPVDRIKPKILWAIGLYLLVSLIIRVALSGGLELDESEQLLLSQTWRWGYGPQPPLYTWLQALSFSVFGSNIFALSLLKNVLLFSTYVCIYHIANQTLAESRSAQIAVLSLFLSPQFGWEFHRTLTNTILATAAAAGFVVLILNIRKKPSSLSYALLGFVAGCGVLAKYNFILLPAAMIPACLSLRKWRPVFLDRRVWISVLTGLFVCIGHFLWVLENLEKAATFSKKLKISGAPLFTAYAQGTLNLIVAAVGLFWTMLIVYILIFLTTGKTSFGTIGDRDIRSLMGRTILIILAFSLLIVFATRLTRFNDRWLAPLLFFVPVYLVSFLKDRITKARYMVFVSLTAVVMSLMLALVPVKVLFASRTGTVLRYNYPYGELSALIAETGFTGGNIIAEDHRVGGNLRLYIKDSVVHVPGRPEIPYRPGSQVLIVWNTINGDTIPDNLLNYVKAKTGLVLAGLEPAYVSAPIRFFKERRLRLGYYIINESKGQRPKTKE